MNHIAYHLKHIHFSKKSGILSFQQGDIRKSLYFQEGNLIYTITNQPEERLGAILLKLGKISKETYSSIDMHITSTKEIGEALVQDGHISKNDLYESWIHQMREITLNTFPVFKGEFFFEERESFVDQEFESTIDIPVLIEDGIRRMKYHPLLKSLLETKVFLRKSNDFTHILSEEEIKILESIDEKSTAAEILNSRGYSAELFWKSLLLLYCLDLIDVKGEREAVDEKEEEKGEFPSEKEDTRFAEVDALAKKLPTLNYYQILDVSNSASKDVIKKAYFNLARRYHPDSFERDIPQEKKGKLEEIFALITKAYQTVADKEKRRAYDSQVDNPPEEEEQKPSKRANIRFRQAKTLYSQKRYEDALVLLEEAVRLDRNKGRIFLLLALTELKIPTMQKKAEENFLRAIDLEPWNPECYVGLGLLYKQEGLRVKAKKQFKKALEFDPDHNIALKELDLVAGGEKKRGFKDLFSLNLFGQKKKK